MLEGILDLPWWGEVLFVLVTTHLTIISVTLYLHRCQAHRALELNSSVSHFFRFWLWLTTGQNTQEWISVHRKHHACTESKDDPHSPYIHGIICCFCFMLECWGFWVGVSYALSRQEIPWAGGKYFWELAWQSGKYLIPAWHPGKYSWEPARHPGKVHTNTSTLTFSSNRQTRRMAV